MAQSTSGWLIPDDVSARAVRERALDLLGSFLTDEQKDEATRHGGYRIEHRGRTFWVRLEGSPSYADLGEGVIRHLCVAPKGGSDLPAADRALTLHLWIDSDPDGFLAEANVMRTEPFDTRVGSDALLEALAGRPVSPPRRRPRRRKKPRSVRGTDPQELRDLFARHGKAVPDADLVKLAAAIRLEKRPSRV